MVIILYYVKTSKWRSIIKRILAIMKNCQMINKLSGKLSHAQISQEKCEGKIFN